ncbi:sodium channel protein Nach [Armigeres subalbatus]|uniref:sodium channel protein Nach n=1 Tax=Armigeres subalbatus TaxID=124917 RepID=UPI002ED1A483
MFYFFIRSCRILLQSFLFNNLFFTIDTAYLHWNTTFPAVSVCQILNDETMAGLLEREMGSNRDYRLDNVMSDIAFYAGTCYSCEHCNSGQLNCPENFSTIIDTYRFQCHSLISNCSWLGRPFDCCQLFHPLETEFGICYSINSQNSQPKAAPKLINNRYTGPGELRFKVNEDLQVYLHDEHSVPYGHIDRTLKENVLWGMNKEIIFKVIELENNENVHDIAIERRDCRFPWEIPDQSLQLYNSYSFSSCAVECSIVAQIALCNCSNHLMPRAGKPTKMCDYKGLTCLTEKIVELGQRRKRCPCLSSCVEPEYSIVHSSESELESDNNAVTIKMLSLPDMRFLRNTVKTETDLFISLGGLMGLFFGMSLLTIIHAMLYPIRGCCSRNVK